MKTRSNRPRITESSVLLVTLFIVGILVLGLGGYLYLLRTQNAWVARSQAWNSALAVAEAGVEEALAQMNPRGINFDTNIDLSANGWGGSGGVYGPMQRTLATGNYDTIIALPYVYSTGFVSVQSLSAALSRIVRVTVTNAPAFTSAMAAQTNITLKGTGLTIDSYDSSDPNYSTDGFYDPAKRRAGGNIACRFGLVTIQNAEIYGTLLTGPTASYTLNNGIVGDLNWTGPGIEAGWYANDFNIDFPDVLPPYTTGVWPTGKGTNAYVLGGFQYYLPDDLVLKSGDTMLVTGNATLYVTGNVLMQSGSSAINIAAGASLTIFVGGTTAAFTQVNTTGNASTFRYYGLPTNTSLSWNGNAQYFGTVYAPEADFNLGGGGSSTYDYQGACVVGSASLNGHFNFHFDENLKRNGPWRGYTVSAWTEM